jgi:hypothetical protein
MRTPPSFGLVALVGGVTLAEDPKEAVVAGLGSLGLGGV